MLTKYGFIFLLTLIFPLASFGETIGAASVEWMTSAADLVAVGNLEKVNETKWEGSVVYESYLLKTIEVIKGQRKLKEIKFVNRSLSDHDSLKKLAQAGKPVLVFLVSYQEKDSETFLHDKLVPLNKQFPLSVISLENPDKYMFDSKFNQLAESGKIIEVCRRTKDELNSFIKQNPAFKLESRVIEPTYISERIQFLVVPNFMFPTAKKTVFELLKEMNDEKDNPRVIAPPPLIFLSGLVLGGLVAWYYPFPILPGGFAVIFGNLLFLSGIGVVGIAFIQMKRAKTNIEPWKPTTAIIDSGLYGISRNPIYLAMVLIYLGLSLLVNSIWLLIFLPLVLLVIHFGVIVREEKYLAGKFGEDYLDYKKRVRRWV